MRGLSLAPSSGLWVGYVCVTWGIEGEASKKKDESSMFPVTHGEPLTPTSLLCL